jgi:hypothetical protein
MLFYAGTIHLVPAGKIRIWSAIHRAMDEVLGADAPDLRVRIDPERQPSRASIPKAETAILWLRNNLPQQVDEILLRARRYCQAPQAGQTSVQ